MRFHPRYKLDQVAGRKGGDVRLDCIAIREHGGKLYAVATDARILAALEIDPESSTHDLLLPAVAWRLAREEADRLEALDALEFEEEHIGEPMQSAEVALLDDGAARVEAAGAEVILAEPGGTFPDWARVIPPRSGEPLSLNAELLVRLQRGLGAIALRIYPPLGRDRAMRVEPIGSDGAGSIMPVFTDPPPVDPERGAS